MRRYVFRLAVLAFAVMGPMAAYGNDTQIAQQIVQKLKQEKSSGGLKGFTIDLQVEEGTVWMTGRVANAQQQARALDLARRVSGVKQVVNDLEIGSATVAQAAPSGVAQRMDGVAPASDIESARRPSNSVLAQRGEIGSGVGKSTYVATPAPAGSPVQGAPRMMAQPQAIQQAPVPYTYARSVRQGEPTPADGMGGAPVAMQSAGSNTAARYDHPSLPGYAWPSYASHPNYAAVTYPKQYSPTAWPYIGPFYPYPQVPLGWRKVELEWDDGWWMLDFKERRTWSRK